MWGHQNHTVLELFMLLSRMHHYQAMTKIKKFVDKEYHRLIQEGEQNPDLLMQQLMLNDEKKSEKILNVPPPIVISKEDNESAPILMPKPKSPMVRKLYNSFLYYLFVVFHF